jgi:hypothetical protein
VKEVFIEFLGVYRFCFPFKVVSERPEPSVAYIGEKNAAYDRDLPEIHKKKKPNLHFIE